MYKFWLDAGAFIYLLFLVWVCVCWRRDYRLILYQFILCSVLIHISYFCVFMQFAFGCVWLFTDSFFFFFLKLGIEMMKVANQLSY